ncbi:MAG: hypothetical protein R3B07_10385 [Polyangiaceae bacterium]
MKKHFPILALTSLIVSACNLSSEPNENLGETQDDITFYPISVNPLQGKPMSGTWAVTSGADNDSSVCRECTYTDSLDYTQTSYPQGYTLTSSWAQQFPRLGSTTEGLPDAFNQADIRVNAHLSGDFAKGLDRNLCVAYTLLALARRVANTGTLDPPISGSGFSSSLVDRLENTPAPDICNNSSWQTAIAQAILHAPTAWRRFFPPQYARHLRSQITPSGLNYVTHNFAEPKCLAEMDGRAARSYCAMRSAATAAGGHVQDLGKHQPTDFAFWKLGEAKGNLRFLPPERFPSGNSEAYLMPMVTGGAVNPITGPLMPRFADLTHPLVWVSGDTQFESQEVWGRVGTTYTGTFPNLVATPVYGWTKRYDNMAHGDYLAGTARTGDFGLSNVELFRLWGVLSVSASFQLALDLGVLQPNHELSQGSAPTRSLNLDPTAGTLFASDGQLLTFTSGFGGIPPWYQAKGPGGLYPPKSTVDSQFGTKVRYQQRDDRTAVVRDSISETLALTGSLSFNIAGIDVSLELNSSATATSQLDTVFREHLSGVVSNQTSPVAGSATELALQSNAMVSVERKNDVTANPLDAILHFHVTIPTPFGDISVNWDKTIYSADPVTLTGETSRSLEAEKLRVGQFGQNGLTAFNRDAQRPSVYSHLPKPDQPGGNRFQSFPQTVGQCLATNGTVPAADPVQDPQPAEPFEPGICLVTYGVYTVDPNGSIGLPQRIPSGVCDGANRVGFINDFMSDCTGTQCAAEQACMEEFVDFNCAEGGEVTWNASPVHSREVDNASRDEFLTLANQCATLHSARGSATNAAQAQDLYEDFQSLYTLTLCEGGVPIGNPHD